MSVRHNHSRQSKAYVSSKKINGESVLFFAIDTYIIQKPALRYIAKKYEGTIDNDTKYVNVDNDKSIIQVKY